MTAVCRGWMCQMGKTEAIVVVGTTEHKARSAFWTKETELAWMILQII